MAIIAQLTRGSLLDVLDQDYIRTAYAKGLRSRVVVWKHALRNALNPVVTAITGWFAELLAGAFFVETIFGWKGIREGDRRCTGETGFSGGDGIGAGVVPAFLSALAFYPICLWTHRSQSSIVTSGLTT